MKEAIDLRQCFPESAALQLQIRFLVSHHHRRSGRSEKRATIASFLFLLNIGTASHESKLISTASAPSHDALPRFRHEARLRRSFAARCPQKPMGGRFHSACHAIGPFTPIAAPADSQLAGRRRGGVREAVGAHARPADVAQAPPRAALSSRRRRPSPRRTARPICSRRAEPAVPDGTGALRHSLPPRRAQGHGAESKSECIERRRLGNRSGRAGRPITPPVAYGSRR